MAYLWLNVADLLDMDEVPGTGTVPINLLVSDEDAVLSGTVHRIGGGEDEVFIIIDTTKKRCKQIADALQVVGGPDWELRYGITTKPPSKKAWTWIGNTSHRRKDR